MFVPYGSPYGIGASRSNSTDAKLAEAKSKRAYYTNLMWSAPMFSKRRADAERQANIWGARIAEYARAVGLKKQSDRKAMKPSTGAKGAFKPATAAQAQASLLPTDVSMDPAALIAAEGAAATSSDSQLTASLTGGSNVPLLVGGFALLLLGGVYVARRNKKKGGDVRP